MSPQAGNDKYDQEHAKRQAKERARAHVRFDELTTDAKKRKAVDPKQSPKDTSSSLSESDTSSDEDDTIATPNKKQKVGKNTRPESSSGESTPLKGKASSEQEDSTSQKKKSKSPKGTGRKKAKKGKRKSKVEA